MTGSTVRYQEERKKERKKTNSPWSRKTTRSVHMRGVSEQGMVAAVPRQKSTGRSKG